MSSEPNRRHFSVYGDYNEGEASNLKQPRLPYSEAALRAIPILTIDTITPTNGPSKFADLMSNLERSRTTKNNMKDLISLACHVQSPGIQNNTPLMTSAGADVQELALTDGESLIPAARVPTNSVPPPALGLEDDQGDDSIKTRAVCFLAACICRLAVKTPQAFLRGISRIKQTYVKMYVTGSSSIVQKFHMTRPMAELIHRAFRSFPEFKSTLLRHVAVADTEHQSNLESIGVLRFCLIQHLEFRGMQAYTMFVQLINHLKLLSSGLYLTWLMSPENHAALVTIHDIAKNQHMIPSSETNPNPSRWWKYARCFDPSYFSTLEPNECVHLLAVQACLLKIYCLAVKEECQDPLNYIAALRGQTTIINEAMARARDFEAAYIELELKSDACGPICRIVYQNRLRELRGLAQEEAAPMNLHNQAASDQPACESRQATSSNGRFSTCQ